MFTDKISEYIEPTFTSKIYIAGDYDVARQICREFCSLYGECVSIERTTFIYTGGEELGVAVRFINYPRFPRHQDSIKDRAKDLAEMLIYNLHQYSASIVCSDETIWITRRKET